MQYYGRQIQIREIVSHAWNDIMNNHAMTMAAGLTYYFVLSLFPSLILAATLLAFLPVPNLFNAVLATMAHVVPPDSMGLVRAVLASVVQPHGGLLTFGVIGTLWVASSGFASLTEALNVAYDVPETRPYWKIRVLALGLMFVIGTLMTMALGLILLGPLAAHWVQNASGIKTGWLLRFWPALKWMLAVAFTIMGVELLYYWGPNVKQRFWTTLPGAVMGVTFFIGTSYGLSLYFLHFANFDKTYGTLGGAMALLTWLYYSWFAILAGAELNAELLKAAGHGKLELKGNPPNVIRPVTPWVEEPQPAA
jgi:membrane protein